MNIRQRFVTTLLVVGSLFAAAPALHAQSYTPDPNHQSVVFNIEHLNLSFVHGRFSELSGEVKYDAKNIEDSSFDLKVPAATVNTGNEKRDGHLKSADFFDVKKYPDIAFKSTSVVKGDDKDEIKVTGDLTLHGVTKSVTVEFEVRGPNAKGLMGFSTELELKRSDYGMSYGVPNIGDTVKMDISFEAIPAKE